MPERPAIAGIKRQKVAVSVSCKNEAGVGGQHARARLRPNFVAPTNLASLVVDGLNYSFAPNTIIRAGPAIHSIGWLGRVEAPTGMCIDDKQSVLSVETGRAIVGQTTFVWRDQATVGRRLFLRIRNWPAILVDSQRPVHGSVGNGQKVLAVGAVENKEVAVARSLHQHLLGLAVKIRINEDRSLDGIPVMSIVRRRLERPHQLAVVGIQGNDTAGVEVVARASRTIQH